MQIANVMLSIGGDSGNQVPKYAVTPSEVALLNFLHGDGSVNEIEIIGETETTARKERARLLDVYGRKNEYNRHVCEAVDTLFPGVAAPVMPVTFADLELSDDMFKVAPIKVEPKPTPKVERKAKAKAEPKAETKAKEEAPAAPEAEDDVVDDEDDIDDGGQPMPDNDMFS